MSFCKTMLPIVVAEGRDLDAKGQCCHIFVLCVTNLLQTYGSSSANLWAKWHAAPSEPSEFLKCPKWSRRPLLGLIAIKPCRQCRLPRMGCQKISPACLTKTLWFWPVFTVLVVVFIWQSGKVMWREVFPEVFWHYLYHFSEFISLIYIVIYRQNSIELKGIKISSPVLDGHHNPVIGKVIWRSG